MDVWGACGADLVLLREIGTCEDLPVCCVDSWLDADEWLRGRDVGRDDDGIEESSFMLGCNGAGADGLCSATGGTGRDSEGRVAVPPQQFPMGGTRVVG